MFPIPVTPGTVSDATTELVTTVIPHSIPVTADVILNVGVPPIVG